MNLQKFLEIKNDQELVQVCFCEDEHILKFHDWRITLNSNVIISIKDSTPESISSPDGVWALTSLIEQKIVGLKEVGGMLRVKFKDIEIVAQHYQVVTEKEYKTIEEETDTLENTIAKAFLL